MTILTSAAAPPQQHSSSDRSHQRSRSDCPHFVYTPLLLQTAEAQEQITMVPINFDNRPSGHRRSGSSSSAPGDISQGSQQQCMIALGWHDPNTRHLNQSCSETKKTLPRSVEALHQKSVIEKLTSANTPTTGTRNGPTMMSSTALHPLSRPLPNLCGPDETIAKFQDGGKRLTQCDRAPKRIPTDESHGDDAHTQATKDRHNRHNHVGKITAPNNHNNINNNGSLPLTSMSPVKSLVKGMVDVVENVQEHRRKAQCRKRITQALLTLRAATEVLEEQKRQKRCDDEEEEEDTDESDWGAALFSPLDAQPLHHYNSSISIPPGIISACTSASDDEDSREGPDCISTCVSDPLPIAAAPAQEEEKFPVQILPEPESLLAGNPRLLTQTMFQQLIDEGVPQCLHMNAWERVFSIGRDGDSFRTLLDHCAPYQYTILVVQTTTGHLLGGFVSDVWQVQDGYAEKHSYYGTGVSFLFADHPQDETVSNDSDKPLSIYPWTGSNDFCQICNMEKSVLAMGGSGAFGFILEDDFYKGSTDRCGTFGNPPLTPDRDGIFTVASMEVYGLVPYGLWQAYSHPMSESPRSVVDTNANPNIAHCA